MIDKNNRITKEQLNELLELIEKIDPENKIFDTPKTIIKEKKYDLTKQEFEMEKNKKIKE